MTYDPYITCKKEGGTSHDVELHHIVPKFMGGKDTDGRKYLCKKHHDILGLIIPKIISELLPPHKKEEAKLKVKEFTLKWLEQDDTTR